MMVHLGSGVFLLLFVLMSFSYAYQLALIIATLTLLTLGGLLAKKPDRTHCIAQLQLTPQGVCSLVYINSDALDDNIKHFQLLATSRFSFLGCWLELLPVSTASVNSLGNDYLNVKLLKKAPWNNTRLKKKQLFIYRDSISPQSFSRLVQVIQKVG